MDDGILHRLALRPPDRAIHQQRSGVIGIAGKIDLIGAVDQRRTGHIERSLDGAGRATAASGLGILGIHVEVEEMFQPRARRDQPRFMPQSSQIADGGPELVFGNVVAHDDAHRGLQQVAHDHLEARIAACHIHPAGLVEQRLNGGGLDEIFGHLFSPVVLLAALAVVVVDR
jgi:hypothetical protein